MMGNIIWLVTFSTAAFFSFGVGQTECLYSARLGKSVCSLPNTRVLHHLAISPSISMTCFTWGWGNLTAYSYRLDWLWAACLQRVHAPVQIYMWFKWRGLAIVPENAWRSNGTTGQICNVHWRAKNLTHYMGKAAQGRSLTHQYRRFVRSLGEVKMQRSQILCAF